MSVSLSLSVSQDEFINTNFNYCARSEDELKAPFVDSGSTVHRAGLRLTRVQRVFPLVWPSRDGSKTGHSANTWTLLFFKRGRWGAGKGSE